MRRIVSEGLCDDCGEIEALEGSTRVVWGWDKAWQLGLEKDGCARCFELCRSIVQA